MRQKWSVGFVKEKRSILWITTKDQVQSGVEPFALELVVHLE